MKQKDRVVEYLKDSDGLSAGDIALNLDMCINSVRGLLSVGAKSGVFVRVCKGKYKLGSALLEAKASDKVIKTMNGGN